MSRRRGSVSCASAFRRVALGEAAEGEAAAVGAVSTVAGSGPGRHHPWLFRWRATGAASFATTLGGEQLTPLPTPKCVLSVGTTLGEEQLALLPTPKCVLSVGTRGVAPFLARV